MNYLFDTDHMSVLQRPGGTEHARLQSQIAGHPNDLLFVSIVSLHEQMAGCVSHANQAKTDAKLLRAYALLATVFAT